jgi:hypothetical protein
VAIARPVSITALPQGLVRSLRRGRNAPDVSAGRRRRARHRMFADVPAPAVPVWRMDRGELRDALEDSRW